MHLARCAPGWSDVVPDEPCSPSQRSWVTEHWPVLPEQAEETGEVALVQPIVGGAESFLHSGVTPHSRTEKSDGSIQWPTKLADLHNLIDSAFIAAVRAPQALTQCDARGLSPLHVAAIRRSSQLVGMLLTLRATVDVVSGIDGRTPLHYAAAAGDKKCVQLLVDHNADLHLRDKLRRLPLELAARVRAEEAQEILLVAMEQHSGGDATGCTGGSCTIS